MRGAAAPGPRAAMPTTTSAISAINVLDNLRCHEPARCSRRSVSAHRAAIHVQLSATPSSVITLPRSKAPPENSCARRIGSRAKPTAALHGSPSTCMERVTLTHAPATSSASAVAPRPDRTMVPATMPSEPAATPRHHKPSMPPSTEAQSTVLREDSTNASIGNPASSTAAETPMAASLAQMVAEGRSGAESTRSHVPLRRSLDTLAAPSSAAATSTHQAPMEKAGAKSATPVRAAAFAASGNPVSTAVAIANDHARPPTTACSASRRAVAWNALMAFPPPACGRPLQAGRAPCPVDAPPRHHAPKPAPHDHAPRG